MGLYLWDRIHQYTGVLFPSSDPATITKSIETQTVYSSSRQVQTVLDAPSNILLQVIILSEQVEWLRVVYYFK